ncbi:hypothetical protein Syun_023627 [Stephania yunnanensis]|uniref:Uncharacterized protein n=1 Tax=Stephania yunnanensis TaxID=152371 RepID=A0AAP0F9C4_9MAGN
MYVSELCSKHVNITQVQSINILRNISPIGFNNSQFVENVDSAPIEQDVFKEQLLEHDTKVDISNNVPTSLVDPSGTHMSDIDEKDDENDNSKLSFNDEDGDDEP